MSFRQDARGGITMVVALIMPVVLGLSALVVDIANLRLNQGLLQQAADAGALAAAAKLSDTATARKAALTLTQLNAPRGSTNITTTQDVEFGVFDPVSKSFSPTTGTPNAVRVTAARNKAHGNAVETLFPQAAGFSGQTALRAVLIALVGTDACLYVLDPSASGAMQFVGSIQLTSTCGLQINSSSNSVLSTVGISSMTASSICIVGSYNAFSNHSSFNPKPQTGCPSKPDPLAGMPEPDPMSSCPNVNVALQTGGTLNPGCYTGNTKFGGTVRLKPGIYQFQGANVSLMLGGTLVGDEVTLYFDKSSSFQMDSHSTLTLAAPKAGPYQGVVFFLSRAAANSTLTLSCEAAISLNGTIYAPATTLKFDGHGSITTKYGYFIVNRLVVNGIATLNFDAFPLDPRRPAMAKTKAALVQ